ncbi:hypothetical protein [Halobacterium salinarum]|uniref:hypothetical protein n=1 Tax=Halobacterium salinarum TaxID=2242 RepID=UPI0025540F36|nr:hypothetical protein [Halobacterium salinarum]MDL0133719.1 hypothetical protein [Halobacterium salinarum]
MLHEQCISSAGAALRKAPGDATPETVLVEPAMQHRNPTYKKDRDSHRAPTDVDLDELPVQEISDRMYRLAELIAQARKLTYEPIEGGRVYGNQGSIDANLTGVIGEIAVQEATGSIEQPIFLRGDRGYDVVNNGTTIDVKATSTHMELPDLLIPHDQELGADVYLLVHRFEPRKVRLVGWAPRHVVENRDPERYPGKSLNYVVRPDELNLL